MLNLINAQQISFEEIKKTQFDWIIAASGYESRASYLTSKLDLNYESTKTVFGFSSRKILSRSKNDATFKKLGFNQVACSGDSEREITHEMDVFFKSWRRKKLKILLDYSSMTRTWYATVIHYIWNLPKSVDLIDLYLSYTPSSFFPPLEARQIDCMGALQGFSGLNLPDRPTALVMGLGYEPQRAIGLNDYLEASHTYAFYADPALDNRFVSAVIKNNKILLNRLGKERIIRYPFANLRRTAALLSSLCMGLSKNYRLILAPLGPKPFSLLCLLLYLKFPKQFGVWRVSASSHGNTYDREPKDKPIICKATFKLQNDHWHLADKLIEFAPKVRVPLTGR